MYSPSTGSRSTGLTVEMNLGGITKKRENPSKAEVFELSQHYIPALMTFPGAPGSPKKTKRQKMHFFWGEEAQWHCLLKHDFCSLCPWSPVWEVTALEGHEGSNRAQLIQRYPPISFPSTTSASIGNRPCFIRGRHAAPIAVTRHHTHMFRTEPGLLRLSQRRTVILHASADALPFVYAQGGLGYRLFLKPSLPKATRCHCWFRDWSAEQLSSLKWSA